MDKKWILLDATTWSYTVQNQGNDVPPITIRLEEPLSDRKLKKIAASNNKDKIKELPTEVLVDLKKASLVQPGARL
jgi:hypothetical protein